MIEKRIVELSDWLKEEAPHVGSDQKHLDAGSIECAYWHYGYLIALRDVVGLSGCTETPPTHVSPGDASTVDAEPAYLWRAYVGSGNGFLHAIPSQRPEGPPVCGRPPKYGWRDSASRVRCSRCEQALSLNQFRSRAGRSR